jgi:hypothetical protein
MYPEEAGITESTTKKICENISFNYDRTESDLSAVNENALSKYKIMIPWQMYLILYKPTDWIIKFGNGLLSLHYSFW